MLTADSCEALRLDSRTKTTGEVYRGEAAELMAAAARSGATQPRPAPRRPVPPPITPEAKRALPYAEPIGINDNLDRPVPVSAPRRTRQLSLVRLLVWLAILPWYLVIAAASIGIIVLFARALLGL